MMKNLKKEFADLDYVCTTADIWTSNHISYIWRYCRLAKQFPYNWESAASACQRFKGTHKYSSCADHVNKIPKTCDLLFTKIVKIVTDNGLNFEKVYREYVYTVNPTDTVLDRNDNNRDSECEIDTSLIVSAGNLLNLQTEKWDETKESGSK